MNDPTVSKHSDEPPVRPVGAWVVAGFLTFTVVAVWILVALVFYVRS